MKISIIAAVTLDGKIARKTEHFPDWTGKSDKKLFVNKTTEAGVVIMGTRTFDLIGKALPERLTIVMTRDTNRISDQKNLIFSNDSAEKIIKDLDILGYKHVMICGGAKINSLFINSNLANELIITFSPHIFGEGVPLISEKTDKKLLLKCVKRVGKNSICAVYQIIR